MANSYGHWSSGSVSRIHTTGPASIPRLGFDIINFIKIQRIKWAGHVIKISEDRTTRKVFNAQPIGTRRKGRPNHRWIDGLEKDLLDLRTRKWRTLAERRLACGKGFLRRPRSTLGCHGTEEGGMFRNFVIYFLRPRTYLLTQTGQTQNHIALAIASSGIAATLYLMVDAKVPLNFHANPDAMCNMMKHSEMAEILRKCKIIIWDECTMCHKHSLEALDRTLKDIKNNTRLFGGALLLLSGDFRQTLPVIPRATYADEINACLKES
ncbi:ATP-dependent DNA helicase [Trichonephila clavipes]|uniref:ATP-dependent DNA helicase n=1 Tax=Trichonephila clavipes TaxID=2585209 RepID=A0A8X6SGP7_TRICX|nr:ATP-dependent DNA helicase [Trichonephila clavipes]